MVDKKPNILVIRGDDIGITTLSCYRDGLMGYCTLNIDRLSGGDWFLCHDYVIFAAQAIVANFLETFKAFPPRQKAASFTMAKMSDAASGAGR